MLRALYTAPVEGFIRSRGESVGPPGVVAMLATPTVADLGQKRSRLTVIFLPRICTPRMALMTSSAAESGTSTNEKRSVI